MYAISVGSGAGGGGVAGGVSGGGWWGVGMGCGVGGRRGSVVGRVVVVCVGVSGVFVRRGGGVVVSFRAWARWSKR